jgi:hypothetical protein
VVLEVEVLQLRTEDKIIAAVIEATTWLEEQAVQVMFWAICYTLLAGVAGVDIWAGDSVMAELVVVVVAGIITAAHTAHQVDKV